VRCAIVDMVCYPGALVKRQLTSQTERPLQQRPATVHVDTQGPGPVCRHRRALTAAAGTAQCVPRHVCAHRRRLRQARQAGAGADEAGEGVGAAEEIPQRTGRVPRQLQAHKERKRGRGMFRRPASTLLPPQDSAH